LTIAIAGVLALARTESSNALGGLPQCSDFVDNDGDGAVDYPADSECSSLADTSESSGGSSSCGPLPCVTFLTQYDPDGSGGAAPIVCQHGIPAFVSTPIDSATARPIDVTDPSCHGTADVSVAVRVPANLDTNKPSIKVTKLSSAPSSLPLRIEAVQVDGSDPSKRQTLGYDTLDSSAPGSFKVALDLSQGQDNDPHTEDVHADVTITNPGSTLAFVSDSFTPGNSLTDRGQNHSNRLEFSGPVPGTIGLDVNTSDARQHIHLTRNAATTLDFLVSQPNDDPVVSGHLERLPASVDVTLNDIDTDGSGGPDKKKIVYDASAPMPLAIVHVQTVRGGSQAAHRLKADAVIHGLPRHAEFAYDDQNNFDWDASGRTTDARITLQDEQPIFARAKWVDASLADVPQRLHAKFGASHIEFSACQRFFEAGPHLLRCKELSDLGSFLLHAAPARPQFDNICVLGPCEDTLSLVDIPGAYDLKLRITKLQSATIDLEPSLDVRVDEAPDIYVPPPETCGPIGKRGDCPPEKIYRPFNVALNVPNGPGSPVAGPLNLTGRISTLLPNTHLRLETEHGAHIVYRDEGRGAGSGPDVRLDGTNMGGLPSGSAGHRATGLHVKLQNMPRDLEFKAGADGFPISLDASAPPDRGHAVDEILDRAEVFLTSGPDDRAQLPESECVDTPYCHNYRRYDGLLYRDLADRYEIFARLRGVRHILVNKSKNGGTDTLSGRVNENAFADNELALKVDVQREKDVATANDRTQKIKAILDPLPQHVSFDQSSGGGAPTRLTYDASKHSDLLDYHDDTEFPAGQSYRDSEMFARFQPMPAHLDVCRSEKTNVCTADILGDKEADSGSLAFHGSERFGFSYLDRKCACDLFSEAGLVMKDFALQADSQRTRPDGKPDDADSGKGYLALDTGWHATTDGHVVDPATGDPRHSHNPPPLEAQVQGVIKTVNGSTVNEVHLGDNGDPGNGFAADHRAMRWNGPRRLYFGYTHTNYHTYCAPGTSIYVKRAASSLAQYIVEGNSVEFNLQNDFCTLFGDHIVPGID
jgi:hypothetical protein